MSEKTCRKCGHTTPYAGIEPQSCMECGAVYRKVEEALRAAQESAAKVQTQTEMRAQMQAQARAEASEEAHARAQAAQSNSRFAASVLDGGSDVHTFARYMRNDSLYPVWRKLVELGLWIGYVAAASIASTSAFLIYNQYKAYDGLWGSGWWGLLAAAALVVIARAGKEVSLMLADLSDASVRLAARSSGSAGSGGA